MGGRQSSQNNTPRQNAAQAAANPLRHSMDGSLEDSSGARRIGGLFGPSTRLSSTPPDRGVTRRRRRRDRNDLLIEAHSLPANLFPAILSAEIKCPVCNKRIGSDEIESHLLACLAKPRVSYNEDVLNTDAGECIICFDDMVTGEHIARLPCLCIYHKKCLDDWFQRNRCCPEHPDQIPQEYSETNSINSANNTNNASASGINITSDANVIETLNDDVDNSPNVFVPPLELDEENTNDNYDVNNASLHGTAQIRPSLPISSRNIELDTSPQNIESLHNPTYDSESMHNSSLNTETLQCQESPISSPNEITEAINDSDRTGVGDDPFNYTRSIHSPSGRTIVHVDDGSIHGSPSLFDDDEIAQLASKIKTILVAESPRNNEIDTT